MGKRSAGPCPVPSPNKKPALTHTDVNTSDKPVQALDKRQGLSSIPQSNNAEQSPVMSTALANAGSTTLADPESITRRSSRHNAKPTLSSSAQRLITRIEQDDENLQILKLKGIITVDSPWVLDRVLDALMKNTQVKARVYLLRPGGLLLRKWLIPTSGVKEKIQEALRANRAKDRRHDLESHPENKDVVLKTHLMWWNPASTRRNQEWLASHGCTSTNVGQEVEVDNVKDYVNSRSLAKVVRKQKGGYIVEYLNWRNDKGWGAEMQLMAGKNLREFKKDAEVGKARKEATLDMLTLQVGDQIEWWKQDCWWKASVLSNQSKNSKPNIRIKGYKLQAKDKVRQWSALELLESSGYKPPPKRVPASE